MTLQPGRGRAPGLQDRRPKVATLAFAAQGVSVAAVYTTVPAVTERLEPAPLLTTALMVAAALTAGGGSFLGLAAIRRAGPVATTRGAVLTAAATLVLIGWAPDEATVWRCFSWPPPAISPSGLLARPVRKSPFPRTGSPSATGLTCRGSPSPHAARPDAAHDTLAGLL